MKNFARMLIIAAFLLVGCAAQAPAANTPLKVAVLPVLDKFPLYVAQRQGYFEQAGVKVELVEVSSAPERDQLMQAGQIDGMLNEPVTTLFYNKDTPRVKMVRFARVATRQYPLFRILAAKGSGIHSVQDLKGVPIGISNGTVIEYLTDRLLVKAGLAPQDIQKIGVPKIDERMALLDSGKLKAAVMPDPVASVSLQKGATLVIDDTTLPEVSSSVYSFSVKTLIERPQAVKAFLAAVEKAVRDINANKEKWKGLMAELKLVPPAVLKDYQVPDFPLASVPSEAQFKDALQWALDKGLVKSQIQYQDCVDSSYLPN